jgi:opacity protein-like surface antigen
MKTLLPAVVSAALLLGPALSFAQNTNSTMPATPPGATTSSGYDTGTASQGSMRQPADLSYSPSRASSDYGAGTNGSWQSGKGMSRTLTEPTFGHH